MVQTDKPVIAFDFDDVLTPHFSGLIAWFNRTYGTKLVMADNHALHLSAWGVKTREAAIERVQHYFDSDDFKHEQPYPEAIEVIGQLETRYKLVVITGRDEMIEAATQAWLEKYFPKVFHAVHFTAQYSLVGKARSKAEVAQSVNAAYFVDDYLPAVLEVASVGIPSIIFGTYPWNQEDVAGVPSVTRCKDWQAVKEYFDAK